MVTVTATVTETVTVTVTVTETVTLTVTMEETETVRTVIVPVERYIEDARVIIRHLLCSVAVMHVPVEDEDLTGAQLVFQVLRRDGNRIKEAEAPAYDEPWLKM